jgi:hypothetical protein
MSDTAEVRQENLEQVDKGNTEPQVPSQYPYPVEWHRDDQTRTCTYSQ